MAGSLVELLKLSKDRSSLKLAQSQGKQVSVRDLTTNKIGFVPITEHINQITCLSSACYMDRQVLALAFTEGIKGDVVSVQIYNTQDPD